MSDVLVVFDAPLTDDRGRRWTAQACGRAASDGLWEGWIEFLPAAGEGLPIRTARETEQPNRADLLYWAEGLTQVFLNGALRRALGTSPRAPRIEVPATPAFDSPRPSVEASVPTAGKRPVLNPFEVYQQGEAILIGQLGALDTGRLRDIADSYRLAEPSTTAAAGREELVSVIVRGVRRGGTSDEASKAAERR